MASRETKNRIREEVLAGQARYDETTRLLLERIAYHRAKMAEERERRERRPWWRYWRTET
jgi:hypothetical protein